MQFPYTLEQLIREVLEEVRQNSEHKLRLTERDRIYKSFGSLSDTLANNTYAWLGILTVKKILPIWNLYQMPDDMPESWRDLPERLIKLAEGVLRRTINLDTLTYEADEAYHIIGGENYPEQLDFVALASLTATSLTNNREPFKYARLTKDTTDDEFDENGDVASAAVKAYAGIFEEGKLVLTDDEYWKASMNSQKQLEFWEWWLIEAIPQAWELAHTTYRPPA
jgi:hypothetical protein